MAAHGGFNRLLDKLMNITAVAKTDFMLGRVHIDIQLIRRKLQVDISTGRMALEEEIAQSLEDRVPHQFVTYGPAIDKKAQPRRHAR